MGSRRLVRRLYAKLEAHIAAPARVVCAESLTAGLLSSSLAAIPGASRYLWGGLVCYRIASKERLLAVSGQTIERNGVVSEAVAREMALGALRTSDADFVVSLTGEAGPFCDGPAPKGRVWIALAEKSGTVHAKSFNFRGNRNRIRQKAVMAAIRELCDFVGESGLQTD